MFEVPEELVERLVRKIAFSGRKGECDSFLLSAICDGRLYAYLNVPRLRTHAPRGGPSAWYTSRIVICWMFYKSLCLLEQRLTVAGLTRLA